jgi:ABC-type branched-subunit amino acid transport system substrate-binding protein
MVRRWASVAAALLLVGCSGGADQAASTTTRALPTPPESTIESATSTVGSSAAPTSTVAAPAEQWRVDTAGCADPAVASAPLSDPLRIGVLAPKTGLPGAAATPIVHALEAGLATLVPEAVVTVFEDPIDPQARAEVVAAADVDVFVGTVGSEASATVADVLESRCIPQLFALGDASLLDDPDASPWNTSAAVAATVEAAAFMGNVAANAGESQSAPGSLRVGVFLTIADSADSTEASLRDAATAAQVSVDLVVRVNPFDGLGVIAAANQLSSADLDAVVLASSGLDCISFLQAWEVAQGEPTEADPVGPTLYLAGACASRAVLRGAGPAADGALSSAVFVDVADPEVAAEPQVAEYLDAMATGGYDAEATFGVAGWVIAQATAATFAQAGESPAGVTRSSLVEAARSLTFQSALLQPEILVVTNGVADPFFFDSVRLARYGADDDSFENLATGAG